jgi:hypothetical protein
MCTSNGAIFGGPKEPKTRDQRAAHEIVAKNTFSNRQHARKSQPKHIECVDMLMNFDCSKTVFTIVETEKSETTLYRAVFI